jgi:hypothetical protein
VYLVDLGDATYELSNVLVVATKQPTSLENLAANTELMTHPLLRQVAEASLDRASEFTTPSTVFTDDWAPVEQVVHGLILSFAAEE